MERSILKEYAKLFGGEYEKTEEELRREIEEGTMELAYIRTEGEIDAFCFFYQTDVYAYFIDYIGVPERRQGVGLGKKILNSVVGYCFSDNLIDKVSLLCSDDKVLFYEKNGFSKIGIDVQNNRIWNVMEIKKHMNGDDDQNGLFSL